MSAPPKKKQPSGFPRIQDEQGAAGLGQKMLRGYETWTIGVQVVDLEMDEGKQGRGGKTLLTDARLSGGREQKDMRKTVGILRSTQLEGYQHWSVPGSSHPLPHS